MKIKNYIKFKKEPYVIAEIVINHNGIFKLAKKLIYSPRKLELMLLNLKGCR